MRWKYRKLMREQERLFYAGRTRGNRNIDKPEKEAELQREMAALGIVRNDAKTIKSRSR